MADDVSAGRLHLDVVSDTSGFARDAKAKVEAATKNLRASIKTELDTRGLVAASRAAAKTASDAAKVRLKAEVDGRGLIAAARAAAASASAAAKVKIGAEIDQAAFQASLAASVAAINNKYTVSVNVEADTTAAAAQLTAFRAGQRRLPIEFGTNVKMGNLPQVIAQFGKLPLIVGGVYALGAAISQLGGGLIALASSAAQAVQTIAVLPNLVGVLAQAGGVLLASFRGIGDAVTASTEAQKAAGATATTGAAQQAAAASRVADAQRAIKDAMKAAADSARESARGVRDANYAYRQSILSVRDAREALTNAEIDAKDRVGDARRAMEDAEEAYRKTQTRVVTTQNNLNKAREVAAKRIANVNEQLLLASGREEEASLAVSRAAQNLQDIQWDAAASPQQIAEAELALKSAQNALAETKVSNEELAAAAAEANMQGVEGSPEVVDAQTDIREAVEDEKDARIDLREFKEDSARADLAQTRAVRDANEALTSALHDQKMAREGIADAERAQRDAAVAGARAIADARRGLGEAMAAQVAGIQQASAAQVNLNQAMDNLGPNGQAFVAFLTGTVLPRLKDMRLAIQEAFLPFVQEGITKALPFLDTLQTGLMGTVGVLGKFVVKVGELFGSKGFNQNSASIMESNNVALGYFLDAALSLIKALSSLAVVAGPTLLEPFAKWVAKVAEGWAEAAKMGQESGTLEKRLDKARETMALLASIAGNLTGALFGLGGAAAPTGDKLLTMFDKAAEKWDTWANSDAGQARMQQFFTAIEPAFTQMMTLIKNLGETFAKLGESGGGPLAAMFKVLNGAVTGLNAVLGTPYLGAAVGWLLTLGGAAGGLALVASQVMKFGNGLALLSKITGITAMFNAFRNSVMLARIQMGLANVQIALMSARAKIAAAAQAVWNVVQGVFNKVMAANPLVKAALLIGALVAVVIYAYKHFEGFRNVVDAVMGAVGKAVKTVWDIFAGWYDAMFGHSFIPDMMAGFQVFWGVVKAIFAALGAAVQWVGGVFSWLWNNVVAPIMPLITAAIGVAWSIIKVIFEAYVAYVQTIIDVIQWLWANVIQPIFAAMPGAIAAAWAIIQPILTALWSAIQTVGDIVGWLWDKVIAPGFAAMGVIIGAFWDVAKVIFAAAKKVIGEVGDIVSWLWTKIIQPAFAAIASIISTWWTGAQIIFAAVKTVLGEVMTKFGDLWDKVTTVFNGIKSTIDNIWGNDSSGIKGVLTAIKDFVVKDVLGAFDSLKTGVGAAWDKMKSAAEAPVKFVVDTIYNNGIRKMIGYLPGVDEPTAVDTSSWKFARGGVMPGYTPGKDVHEFYSPTAGNLALSGGEAIMRPEWTRAIGSRGVDVMNAAARRGKYALRNVLGNAAGPTEGARHAMGGVIRNLGGFFLGGTMPLAGASTSQHHDSKYAGYPYAGDLNYPGYTDFGKPIVAWKDGIAHPFDMGDTSYGRGQLIDHGSQSTMYAHMSSVVTSLAGQAVKAGQVIGAVGDYGNTGTPPTSHLHFEVRGGGVDAGDTSTAGGPSKADQKKAKAEKKKDGWLDVIKNVKDVLGRVPEWASKLSGMGGDWAGNMKATAKDMGTRVLDWINEKIPDKIKIPGPIPDLPIPNIPNPFGIFDQGGEWKSGTLGMNASGKTEMVLTNENLVDALASIADISKALKSMTVDAPAGGPAPLVGELTLVGRDDERPAQFRDAMMQLNLIQRGGVHADRPVA